MSNVRGQGALPIVNGPQNQSSGAAGTFDYDLLVTLAALDVELVKRASAAGVAADLLFPKLGVAVPRPVTAGQKTDE